MIEVIIGAALLGVIVVGTFSGFNAADRSSTEDRLHNEATVIAAQSEEELRSAPASALETLATEPHKYTQTAADTNFEVSQEARFVSTNESTGCSVTEQKSQVTNALRITSSITWPQLSRAGRKPLTETSVITPPTGSALEVDVGNAPAPTAGVPDVDVVVNYTPAGSSTPATLEATTGEAGCVVFGAIPASSATVEIPELTGYVIPSGSTEVETKEVTLAPNVTTHYPVTFNRGGSITARFTYNGSTEYSHTNNAKSETIKEKVKGDTFVASNINLKVEPFFEVGSVKGKATSNGLYEPEPATAKTYAETATSPETTKYPLGNLFPFPKPDAWTVYAGDCTANDPENYKVPLSDENAIVQAGGPTTEVAAPTSYTLLDLYEGTEKAHGNLETSEAQRVNITNTKCAGVKPNNETAVKDEHTQETTTGSSWGGHLEAPFQPFGVYELCLYDSKLGKIYTVSGENNSVEGTTPSIFLAQRSAQEWATLTSEATSKQSTREKEEAALKTAQTKEEATKRTDETKETEERTKWLSEEGSRHITKSARETKEKEQTTARQTRESQETTSASKRKTEETALKERKTQEETAAAREKTEKEEGTAVKVESGKSGCP